MKLTEITKRADTLYLMVDYSFEADKIKNVAAKSNIEVYDDGNPSVEPMAFGVEPNSLAAEYFMDDLNTWGYSFKDVTDLWSTKPEVFKTLDKGNTDKVAKSFVNRSVERDFREDITDKDTFVGKLKDPEGFELQRIVDQAEAFGTEMNDGNDEYSFEIYSRGETTYISISLDRYSDYFTQFDDNAVARRSTKLLRTMRELAEASDIWNWAGTVGLKVYLVRK